MTCHATQPARRSLVQAALQGITQVASRFPMLTLAACLGLAAVCTVYARDRLSFKTSRADLIDPKTEYHQRWINYTREFGDVTEDMVIVVEGDDPATITQTLDELGTCLERESDLFKNVLYKVDLSHLREK